MNLFRSGSQCKTKIPWEGITKKFFVVIIGVEIPDNKYGGILLSMDTIRRNEVELVYKCSVKDGFFFVVHVCVGRGWMRNLQWVN